MKTTNKLMQSIEISSTRAERSTDENTEEIKGFKHKIKSLVTSTDKKFEAIRQQALKQAAIAK